MIESLGKTEMVYKALQEDIIEGRLSPGQRLVERELMEKFGVSKTPVREALVRLKQDGLIDGALHQGVSVIRISRKDAVEIYDLREILEGMAAKKVAEKITPDNAEKLDSIIQLFEKHGRKNDLKAYAQLDVKFHDLIGVLSNNQRLYQMVRRIYHQSRILLRTSLNLPIRGPEVSLGEHKKVVEAIVNKNPSLAEKMAREHIKNTREAVLDWFDRTYW